MTSLSFAALTTSTTSCFFFWKRCFLWMDFSHGSHDPNNRLLCHYNKYIFWKRSEPPVLHVLNCPEHFRNGLSLLKYLCIFEMSFHFWSAFMPLHLWNAFWQYVGEYFYNLSDGRIFFLFRIESAQKEVSVQATIY